MFSDLNFLGDAKPAVVAIGVAITYLLVGIIVLIVVMTLRSDDVIDGLFEDEDEDDEEEEENKEEESVRGDELRSRV